MPADVPTIAAALGSASSGDTVLVDCGTWFEHDLAIPSGVTLRSVTGHPDCTVIDAQALGRVIDVKQAEVRIEGLTLRNGMATTGADFGNAGGAVRCDRASLALADCVLVHNYATFGAGLASRASILAIDRCVFAADSATATQWAAGGGLYGLDSGGTISDCTFDRNGAYATVSAGDGGGAFLQACDFVLSRCSFTSNGAGVGAGGLYSFLDDSSRVRDCTFTGNAAAAGAAVYVEAAKPRFDGCTFTGNTASNGGAMFIDAFEGVRSRPVIVGCTFENAIAEPYAGGALDIRGSDVVIDQSTFRCCTSGTKGGAVAARDKAVVSLSNCLFDDNAATYGGALWCGGGATTVLTRCTVRGSSTSSPGGGAIEAVDDATIFAHASISALSTAGAGAVRDANATLTLTCCDLYGNAGGDWIGGVADQQNTSGNFSADPLFCVSATNGAVRYPDSPCLAGNSPCGGRVGVARAGCGNRSESPAAGGNAAIAAARPDAAGSSHGDSVRLAILSRIPFSKSIELEVVVPRAGPALIHVYDVRGRSIRALPSGTLSAGRHVVRWDGNDESGNPVGSGVFFVRLSTGHGDAVQKCVRVE